MGHELENKGKKRLLKGLLLVLELSCKYELLLVMHLNRMSLLGSRTTETPSSGPEMHFAAYYEEVETEKYSIKEELYTLNQIKDLLSIRSRTFKPFRMLNSESLYVSKCFMGVGYTKTGDQYRNSIE